MRADADVSKLFVGMGKSKSYIILPLSGYCADVCFINTHMVALFCFCFCGLFRHAVFCSVLLGCAVSSSSYTDFQLFSAVFHTRNFLHF